LASERTKVQQEHVVRYLVGGQSFIIGKVITVRGKRVFYFRLRPEKDILQKLDAISLAPELIHHLEREESDGDPRI